MVKVYKTKEYSIWSGIKRRCYSAHRHNYKYYGGKGIKMCDRWLSSFENFLADMGKVPSKKHTIDRIDRMGDYCPENCRWATQTEQANNKSCNLIILYNGRKQTLTQWCREFNLPFYTIKNRIYLSKWSIDDAFTKPIKKIKSSKKNIPILYKGKSQTLMQWCKELGFRYKTIQMRRQHGWTIEDALSRPLRAW